MNNTANSLVEGLERLGLIASRIRQNMGNVPQIEIDIILQELRNLYMTCLYLEKDSTVMDLTETLELDLSDAAKKATEEKRMAEEAAAKKAAEEKRLAEEAAAKKAAEEKRLAEEAAAKKAAEEKRLAEEAATKKAAEEKRLAEEAAAKKAAEEKRLAEEAAAKKAAEEKRLAEEAAAKKAAMLAASLAANVAEPHFAPADDEGKGQSIKPQMEQLAGNPNDDLFSNTEEPEPLKEQKPRETSLFDYLKTDRTPEQPKTRTIGDTLNQNARNAEHELEMRMNAKKVDDLRTIININDKFVFMGKLFGNKMKEYNDFILHLNELTDRQEALDYVAEIAKTYNWEEGSSAVNDFYKVFDRKF